MLFVLQALALLLVVAAAHGEPAYKRIVSLGPDVTEIAMALGAADRIVAVDRSSRYPEAAAAKSNVGYRRALSAEGIVALNPDLILAAEDIGPPEAVDILKGLSVPMLFVPEGNSGEGIVRKIEIIAEILGEEEKGKQLAATVLADFREAADLGASIPESERRKVVFFHGLARLTGAGSDTSADAIIRYAGGINPLAEYSGYKAVSEEKLLEVGPDVVLMMPDAAGGPKPEDVFAIPALATTPAGKNKALVVLQGPYMLGFGPRTAEAIRDLARALYPDRLQAQGN
ncbi:ABC transporter substrate-binding protein [Corticibacterium sp. UT-5YL-CI-8]|nr:ABC transporter substrate-binding protein [Tianweitania sp. UT-5YL-CI-8]